MKAKPRKASPVSVPPIRLFLRVRHPSIDPSELTQAFGIAPLHSFRAGEICPAGTAGAAVRRHAESYWLAEVVPQEAPTGAAAEHPWYANSPVALSEAQRRFELLTVRDPDVAVSALIMQLLAPHAKLLKRLRSEEGDVALRIELDPGHADPITIAPPFLGLLAEYGVALSIEFIED